MKRPERSRRLIIGVGNEYRGDDGVGLMVTRRLREQRPRHFMLLEERGEGTALMESWQGAEVVIVIDAVYSGARPGTIHRFDGHAYPLSKKYLHHSTHAISVAEAIELSKVLGRMPSKLVVYGIEGKDFSPGIGLSTEVEEVVDEVVRHILRDVNLEPSRNRGI